MAVTEQQGREKIVQSIEEELTAFPGVTVSMLHARLTVKRGPSWREILEELIREGLVIEVPKVVAGRGQRTLYWYTNPVAQEFVRGPSRAALMPGDDQDVHNPTVRIADVNETTQPQ